MPKESLEGFRKVEIQVPGTPILPPFAPALVFNDVTRDLGSSDLTVEESDEAIDSARFTIKHNADLWIENIVYGMQVRIEGGYMAKKGQGLFGKGGEQVSRIYFQGIITDWNPVFPDSGKPELEITCHTNLYNLTKRRPGRVTYPTRIRAPITALVPDLVPLDAALLPPTVFPTDPTNPGFAPSGSPANVPEPEYARLFHFRQEGGTIKMSEIISGILKEYGLNIKQVKIDDEDDYEFTLADPISQNETESDFDFILRLLSGKTELTSDDPSKENVVINGRARIFEEYDHKTQSTRVNVVPEHDLIQDVGTEKFFYHVLDAQRLDIVNYDPTSKGAQLIMRNISFEDNPDEGKAGVTAVKQDVNRKGNKRKNKGAPSGADADVGDETPEKLEQRSEDGSPANAPYPFNYELDRQKVRAAVKAGELTPEDAVSLAARAGHVEWEEVKHWFKEKTQHEASGRVGGTLDGATQTPEDQVNNPELESESTTTGKGKKRKRRRKKKKKAHKERVKKYGMRLGFRTHGSIFVMSRKSYFVNLATIDRYSGLWYCAKVVHSLNNPYRMQVELVR